MFQVKIGCWMLDTCENQIQEEQILEDQIQEVQILEDQIQF